MSAFITDQKISRSFPFSFVENGAGKCPAEPPGAAGESCRIFLGEENVPTAFTVRASANKGNFSASLVSENPLRVKAAIPEEPVDGKATRMLLSCLEELLSCKVELLSGATSRKKILAADCEKEELIEKIRKNERK